MGRRPAEPAQLRRVDGVAAVVARPVLDVPDDVRARPGQVEDALHDVHVLALLAAQVVGLARRALPQRDLDPVAVVLDMQPLAALLAVAVDGQVQPVEGVRDEERQELLRVLARPVGVRAARDERIDAERPDVGEHLQLTAGLRRRVRARRAQRRVLGAPGRAERDVAVHLIGRNVHEPDLGVAHVVEQHLGAEHVGEDELSRAEDGPVDVRLGRKVDDRVAALRRARDGVGIDDVALVELVLDALEVGAVPGVGELVEHHDVLAPLGQMPDEVRADEARAAGDENAHRYRVLTAARGTRAARRASAAARVRPFRYAAPSRPGAGRGRRTRRFRSAARAW